LFLSEQRATLSTTHDSPSVPLNIWAQGRYFLEIKMQVRNNDAKKEKTNKLKLRE
jgi:uncharacterized protein YqkB